MITESFYDQRQRLANGDASMRPRSDDHGKIRLADRPLPFVLEASMRPRSDDHGKAEFDVTPGAVAGGFNEAAIR